MWLQGINSGSCVCDPRRFPSLQYIRAIRCGPPIDILLSCVNEFSCNTAENFMLVSDNPICRISVLSTLVHVLALVCKYVSISGMSCCLQVAQDRNIHDSCVQSLSPMRSYAHLGGTLACRGHVPARRVQNTAGDIALHCHSLHWKNSR